MKQNELYLSDDCMNSAECVKNHCISGYIPDQHCGKKSGNLHGITPPYRLLFFIVSLLYETVCETKKFHFREKVVIISII